MPAPCFIMMQQPWYQLIPLYVHGGEATPGKSFTPMLVIKHYNLVQTKEQHYALSAYMYAVFESDGNAQKCRYRSFLQRVRIARNAERCTS